MIEGIQEYSDNHYMTIAKVVAENSPCHRRKIGAIIVKDDNILAQGCNKFAVDPNKTFILKEFQTCKKECLRNRLDIESGTRLEVCNAVHAEMDAIIQCAINKNSTKGATLYVTTKPCPICARNIIDAKIERVVCLDDYPSKITNDLFMEAGVLLSFISNSY